MFGNHLQISKKPPTDRLILQVSHRMFYLSAASTCLASANWLCTPISTRDLQTRLNLALFQPGTLCRSQYSIVLYQINSNGLVLWGLLSATDPDGGFCSFAQIPLYNGGTRIL